MIRFWQRFSWRERWLLIFAIFVLLSVLGRYFLISPFLEHREWVKSQLDIQPQILEKDLRYLNQKKEIEEALEKARGELKVLGSSLLSGDTPSVSASDLQNIIGAITAKEGAKVITIRVLNPETFGSYTKISIQVEITGQIDQVANLFKGIQSTEKLLIVNELNLTSFFTPFSPAKQQPGGNIPSQNLRTSFILSGFSQGQISKEDSRSEGGA